jgi:hypothetical protein
MVTFGNALQIGGVAFVAAWVLTWYPPAPGEALWEIPRGWLPAAVYLDGPVKLPRIASLGLADIDAMAADEWQAISAGPASVLAIANTPADPGLITGAERQAQIDAWVHAPAAVSGLDWSTVDDALQRFLAPLDRIEQARVEVDAAWYASPATQEIPRILVGAAA